MSICILRWSKTVLRITKVVMMKYAAMSMDCSWVGGARWSQLRGGILADMLRNVFHTAMSMEESKVGGAGATQVRCRMRRMQGRCVR